MTSHQNTGRKSKSTTANKKVMNTQAAVGKTTKDTVQAEAAYPSPEQTPPVKSPALFHEDSGFQEEEDTPSHASGTNYKDFTLYPERSSEYDSYNFFADVDASVQENNGSIFSYNDTAREAPAKSQVSSTRSYDPVPNTGSESNLASDDHLYEAIGDYETRFYPYYSMTSEEDYIQTPLGAWECTFERHESLAYRLEQPPYPARYGREY